MNKWKTYKLGEIVDVLGDGIHGTPIYNEAGDYYFINGNNLGEGYIKIKENTLKVDEKEYLNHKKNLTDRTLLLSINGTLGNVAKYRGEPCILGKSACYFNISESCERDFIYYIMISPLFRRDLENMATGTTIKNVSLKALRNYEISLPPLAEQKRIADILSAIDDKIELNRRINANLEQQAQALYKSWFVDFEPFGGKMPEDWRVGTLGEICITNKRSYSGKFYNSFEYLDTGSVTSNKIDTIQLLNPTIDKIPSRARRAVTEGDILYSSVRPNQKHYMFLYNPSSNMVVSTGFIVITANWSGYRYYIYQYLIQDIVIQHLQSIAEQSVSTYPSISASDITNMEINIPSNKAIEKYANVMNPIMKQITNNQSENLRLAQLRDTLLPKLMSGEITV